MLELLCAVCAALAIWLWIPTNTPTQRLTHLTRLARRARPGSTSTGMNPQLMGSDTQAMGSDTRAMGPDTQAMGWDTRAMGPGAQFVRSGARLVGPGTRLLGTQLVRPGTQVMGAGNQPVGTAAESAGVASEPAPSWLDHSGRRALRPDRRTIIAAVCAGSATGVVITGVPGVVAGLLAAAATAWTLHHREPPAATEARRQIAADLPFAADLMVACLLAGQPVSNATEAAGEAVAGPLGTRLAWVSSQLRLGADPDPTWSQLAREPTTAVLARAMSRAAQSGAPVADVLTRLADDARDNTRATSLAAARRVGVKAVAPLGLCFLPAFVLLGIIPIIASLANTILLP